MGDYSKGVGGRTVGHLDIYFFNFHHFGGGVGGGGGGGGVSGIGGGRSISWDDSLLTDS